jgi:hypothetical protein
MPHLPGERAFQEQVVDRLQPLVTQWATWWVLQSSASGAINHPAAVEVGQPVEEAHAQLRLALPGELAGIASDGAMQGCQTRRVRRVGAAPVPLPAQVIRLCGERREQQVLAYLRDVNYVVYV